MKVLAFSPSIKKMWIDDLRKLRNPSYWLLGMLTKALSYEHEVFVPEEGVEVCGRIKPYKAGGVDVILLLGCDYSPGSNGTPFKKGWHMAQRAFDVAEKAKRCYDASRKPLVIFLSVDVRGWEPAATDLLGFAPTVEIGEAEIDLHFQHIGLNLISRIPKPPDAYSHRRIGFHGHAKRRLPKFAQYVTKAPKIPFVIDGSGWDKLKGCKNVTLRGPQQFFHSAAMMFRSFATLTLHEPAGEARNWITSRVFENFAFGLVTFIDQDYDQSGLVVPRDSLLRVTPETLPAKFAQARKDASPFLKEQSRLLGEPVWKNFMQHFYQPFKKRLLEEVAKHS